MTPISHYFVHRLIKAFTLVVAFFIHAHLSLGEYGAAQAACTDSDPIISGKSLVCANEQTNYTTPLVANTTCTWVLASGGQIVSTANNNVTIKWNNQPSSGPHKLTVTQTNINGCIKTTNYFISIKDISLRCIGNFNVSIDNTCKITLTTEGVLLPGHIGASEMKIQLLAGSLVLEEGIGSVEVDGVGKNGVNYEFISKTFIYKIIEPCSGNFCSGNVKFEDKAAPIIQCPNDATLGCAQVGAAATPLPQDSGTPRLTDCSPTTFTYSDQIFETTCTQPYTALPSGVPSGHPLPTTGDIVKIIVRTFIAADKWGNTSTCQQVIFVKKGKIQYVVCPPDVEYECKNVTGKLDPSVTGFPLLDLDGDFSTVNDRYPVNQSSCQMDLKFKDDTFRLCAGSYKIVRAWTIFDWCAVDNPATLEDDRRKNCSQVITVMDKTPPSVSAQFTQYYVVKNDLAPMDTTALFDGYYIQNGGASNGTITDIYPLGLPNTCGGRVRILLKGDDWSCTMGQVVFTASDSRMKILSGYPQFNAQNQTTTALFEGIFLEIGEYLITLEAKDECGYAIAKKTFRIIVRDNIKPQAVCASNTTASLGTDGSVRIQANTFNSGSADNCGIDRVEVRRNNSCQNPADTLFKPYVDFYCCDAGSTIMVTMRVWDQVGNYNDCMVNVYIDDKLKPTCIAPAPKTIVCSDLDLNDLTQYGEPALWDNCRIKDTLYTFYKNIDNCGIGTITRKWVISDFTGKKDSCTQLIKITGKSDFTVDFPDDIVADCFATVPTPTQTREMMLSNTPNLDGHIVNNGCGVIAVEVKDDTLTATPDACYKILRQIKVIDWCKYNPNNSNNLSSACYGQPVCGDVHSNGFWQTQNLPAWQHLNHCFDARERTFRDADGLVAVSNDPLYPVSPNAFSDGIICFTQIIKIIDNTPPQFTYAPRDTIFKDALTGCAGVIKLSVNATDGCNGVRLNNDVLTYKWRVIDRTKTDSLILQGVGNQIVTTLAYNREVTIYWSVYDRCGNFSTVSHKVKVVDGKAPSIQCLNKNAELAGFNGSGSVTVNVNEVVQGVSDNCTSIPYLTSKLAIVRASANGVLYPSVQSTSVTFTCADAGKKIPVQIWTMDEAGNANYCLSEINVQDNLNACSIAPLATITGTTKTETDKAVPNVTITTVQNGNALGTMTSTATGTFSFGNLMQGLTYQVKANRVDNPGNGVTTFDIALVSKHLLGIQSLGSPYKLIAADVNKDGEVSAADMLYMRKVILRALPEFPNNTSWRFVDKNYVFTNPENPFISDFPEVVNINNLPIAAQANFVAIKIGDVNNTVNPLNLTGGNGVNIQVRNAKTLNFEVEDKEMQAGFEYTIPFKSTDFNALGYQFTLNHTEGVEVVKIINGTLPSMSDNNFGKFKNALTTSWNGSYNDKNAEAFSLVLKANKSLKLSDILSIGSNMTTAEAYDKNGEAMSISLIFKGLNSANSSNNGGNTEGSGFNLYQNNPNPFDSDTDISFNIPKETQGKLTVFDATGRIVKTVERVFKKGYNAINIEKSELNTTGVFFYRLDTPTHSATKKMIVTQ